jgi:hypothetical protein
MFPPLGNTLEVSTDEASWLWQQRLLALADATARYTGAAPLPIAWRSQWKASLHVLGRHLDGSLRARIVVRRGNERVRYVRRLRGPRQRSLNPRITLRLRES